ncbi:MAG: hypothetical protein IPP06_16560 [Saprospiraceae bacterium]|nr:hypothetical protein [Candidatus Vicinibacter affinis]
MNVKEVEKKVKLKTNTSKTKFPQVKIEGFQDAIKNTDMLKVVEQIKGRKSRSHNKCFDASFGYRQKPSQRTAVIPHRINGRTIANTFI